VNITEWINKTEAERKQKDEFFALHPQSPIPMQSRADFEGLDYFPPDPGYYFELEIHPHENKQIVGVQDTAGNTQEMVRWGEFRFTIEGEEYKLQAYQSNPSEARLFIPFRDATSGEETYGAGRYLDLEPERHLTADGKWIVDFNKAYNPWCAYSENYVCPFVPPENWLQVPIRAGEKKYPPEKA